MTRVKKRLEIIINRAASARNFRLPPLLLDGDQRSRESYAFVQNRISDRLISGNKLFLLDVRNIPIYFFVRLEIRASTDPRENPRLDSRRIRKELEEEESRISKDCPGMRNTYGWKREGRRT